MTIYNDSDDSKKNRQGFYAAHTLNYKFIVSLTVAIPSPDYCDLPRLISTIEPERCRDGATGYLIVFIHLCSNHPAISVSLDIA